MTPLPTRAGGPLAGPVIRGERIFDVPPRGRVRRENVGGAGCRFIVTLPGVIRSELSRRCFPWGGGAEGELRLLPFFHLIFNTFSHSIFQGNCSSFGNIL